MQWNIRNVLGWIVLVLMLAVMISPAVAEDAHETVWVLCQPDSYVNIREKPSKWSQMVGYACCGDDFRTDGKTRNGFLHVYTALEVSEAWIAVGYVVYSEPVPVGEVWSVESNGRVAARSAIGGRRRTWLKDGQEVKVYWVAEYAVTDCGFVDARYVGPRE